MVSRGHLFENDFSTININLSQISSQLTLNGSNQIMTHHHFQIDYTYNQLKSIVHNYI